MRAWLLALALLLCPSLGLAADLPLAATPVGEDAVPAALPCRVDRLDIHGLWRTERKVVERELPFRPGDTVTVDAFRLARARLWNLGLFSRVALTLEDRAGERVLVIELEERWTINLLFSFQALARRVDGRTESTSALRFGLADSNLFGRLIEVAAEYERFDQWHGARAYLKDPRLFDSRWEGTVLGEYGVRPRPDFLDRRLRVGLDLSELRNRDTLRIGGHVDLLHSTFLAPLDKSGAPPPEALGLVADVGVRLGRVDTVRIRQRGAAVEVRPGLGWTVGGDRPGLHGQANLIAWAYHLVGDRGNLAARLQLAAMTAAPVHLRYHLGGLADVRGFRDNAVRTLTYAQTNLEARWIAWDSTWLALMPAAFLDAAVADGDALAERQAGVRALVSTGAGLRALVPRLVRTGLRVDVATPLTDGVCPDVLCPQLSVGVYQFF